MLTDDLYDRLYDPDLPTFLANVERSVPADAAPAAVADARLWHAQHHAAVTAGFNPFRLGKGVVGGGRFAKRGDVGIPLLRDLLRGRGTARKEIHATFDKRLRANDDWGRGDITPAHLTEWATKAFGARPNGQDGNAWDAGRRELGAYLAAIPDRSRVPNRPDTHPGDGGDGKPAFADAAGNALEKGSRVRHADGRVGIVVDPDSLAKGKAHVEFRNTSEYVPHRDLTVIPHRGQPGGDLNLDGDGRIVGFKPDTPNVGQANDMPNRPGVQWPERTPTHALAKAESYEPDFSAMKYPVPKPLVEHIRSGDGTRENPFETANVDAAAHLLANDQHVRLTSVDQVSTLLDKLHSDVQAMKAQGEKAPTYDLCKVTVPGTNLFCAESKGIPRTEMPQLSGIPIPGSKADSLPKDAEGGVNLGPAFIEHLKGLGINVTRKEVPASHLKASQNQLNGAKIVGMMNSIENGSMGPGDIFTSRDNYVVDGHHRWAANVGVGLDQGTDMNMGVNEVDADILDVLALANQFALDQGIPQAGVGDMGKGGGGHVPNIQPIDVNPPNAPSSPNAPDAPAAADGMVDWGPARKPTYSLSTNPNTGARVRMSDDDFDALSGYGSASEHITGRDADGSPIFTPERQALHDQIVEQLTAGVQPSDNPIFYMLGGGPAAGKSTMLADDRVKVPGEGEAVTIDSDHIKSLLPEYQQMVADGDGGAASFAHEESSYLAKRVMATAFAGNLPTLLDGTGDSSAKSVQKKIDAAHEAGYRVQGMYATVPTQVALDRADARAAETGRVVPHSVIEGTHASVSRIFPELASMFDDLMLFENSDGPKLIAEAHDGSLNIHDQGEYDSFLAKATPNAPNVPEAAATITPDTTLPGRSGGALTVPDGAAVPGQGNDMPNRPGAAGGDPVANVNAYFANKSKLRSPEGALDGEAVKASEVKVGDLYADPSSRSAYGRAVTDVIHNDNGSTELVMGPSSVIMSSDSEALVVKGGGANETPNPFDDMPDGSTVTVHREWRKTPDGWENTTDGSLHDNLPSGTYKSGKRASQDTVFTLDPEDGWVDQDGNFWDEPIAAGAAGSPRMSGGAGKASAVTIGVGPTGGDAPAAAPKVETPGQQSLLPRDQQTATDLLGGDTSPENIAKLLKSGDLTDAQREELHRLLDAQTGSARPAAVTAALAIADQEAARQREAAVAAALAMAERARNRVR